MDFGVPHPYSHTVTGFACCHIGGSLLVDMIMIFYTKC